MRFALLGSGSKGNAALFSCRDTHVLLDCGFSVQESTRRLQRLGVEPESLAAIVVTHEHSDHLGGVARVARRYGLPVWMTRGTHAVWNDVDVPCIEHFDPHTPFAIGDLEMSPYPVPHDAREPAQFVVGNGATCIGVLSDAGSVTPHMCRMLQACDSLLIEFNHDSAMLASGPYPESLKRRVGGAYGHLSNMQAADLLRRIDTSRVQHVVLTHLSEKNNTPELALTAGAEALGCETHWLVAAEQDQGLAWREIS
ncbi:MBL fold metallo-hydrolase [Algiphilus sp. W345]|uniref:MBL fold metallo-hydrolase n=1 Tax=Banduia mediterranea TaxID=3075609 RepID=A0ABU2WHU8_9GAMM|nr:MBL fold metallo-hydrolase [Algiphilus sp. W345]MDT0497441.1 MBL fold metallo-hydrolase [Algiphilus sp. W345]